MAILNKNRGRSIFVCAVLILVVLGIYLCHAEIPPSEISIKHRFQSQHMEFESLRAMLSEDRNLRAVYRDFGVEVLGGGIPRYPEESSFDSVRYSHYVRVLKSLDATEVYRPFELSNAICITVWAGGFGGNTRRIDVCSMPDGIPTKDLNKRDQLPQYSQISHDWYVRKSF